MKYIDLSKKIAIVTGGGGVIPKGIAQSLGEAGAEIYLVDNNLAAAEKVAEELSQMNIKATAMEMDITKIDVVEKVVAEIFEREKHIDILVNAAGVMRSKPYMDLTDKDFDFTLAINLVGMDNCCRSVLKYMIPQKSGRIVNISSVAGRTGAPTAAHYSASKFGVIGLTQAIAGSVVRDGITVNTVCPGSVMSPLMQEVGAGYARALNISVEEGIKMHIAKSPLGAPQTPEDMGNAVLFFCSNLSDHITGVALNVCGGKRMD